nr:MAG TPA: protein of unknown function (DUF4972) [Caudoviricetes sp.]
MPERLYSANERFSYPQAGMEKTKKLLKIIVITYLTMIFNLLFISCLIYNR